MKAWKTAFRGICFVFIAVSTSFGSTLNGGPGLLYTNSAWVQKPGHLTLKTHTRFFGKVKPNSAVTIWNVHGAFSLNYGVTDHLELDLSPVMYQDSHKGEGGKGYNLPDDIFLGLKLGSYRLFNNSLSYGAVLQARFPTADNHNLVFEPYSAPSLSWGFTGLMTYSQDPLYPEDNLNVHFNLGYFNYNDVGEKLSEDTELDTIKVKSMTQEFQYRMGIKIPSAEFDFSLELFGNAFLQKPPKETAYSLENYIYLTPGVTYNAARWISLIFAADLRLSGDNDESLYYFDQKVGEMPNYPSWRINLGLKLHLLPTSVYKVSEKDVLIQKAESRRELFEQIIREQRETESAEEELERIKNERRKAERELERLRRILEGESKSNEPQPED